MLVLDDYRKILSDSSSKGNQRKFYVNGNWIKLDNEYCYEGLAEHFVSCFCYCIEDFPHVQYISDRFEYRGNIYNGCYSANMFKDDYSSFISFRSLFKQYNIPKNILISDESISVNIQNTVSAIKQNTGVDLLNYLGRLLMLDCLIINEDRHIMNLGAEYNGVVDKYFEVPCFDNGSSLFCTNWTYKSRKSLEENIDFAKSVARPFSKFYDKQLNALLDLGCPKLKINKSSVDYLLKNYSNKYYSDDLIARVKYILKNRLDYYEGWCFVYV